jgi:hypothetical protein
MLKSRLSLLGVTVASVFSAQVAWSYDAIQFENELDAFVREHHDHAYYFDKLAFDGITWVPTVLVFGYPNNGAACRSILNAANTENPTLNFRCRSAE